MSDVTDEWHCEFTLKNIPFVPREAVEAANRVVRGVVSYDGGAFELYGVFRLTGTYTLGDVLTEVRFRMGRALSTALGAENLVLLVDRVKDVRVRPASDVPVDPDVQRFVDKVYGKDR